MNVGQIAMNVSLLGVFGMLYGEVLAWRSAEVVSIYPGSCTPARHRVLRATQWVTGIGAAVGLVAMLYSPMRDPLIDHGLIEVHHAESLVSLGILAWLFSANLRTKDLSLAITGAIASTFMAVGWAISAAVYFFS
jgi:hypothetical protein